MGFYGQNNLAQASILLKKRLERLSVKESTKQTSQEKIDLLTNLKLAQFILASGKVGSGMDTVSRLGQTERSTQESGAKTELMVKESSSM